MTEWLSKEKEKEKQKGDIDRRRGRRRFAFFFSEFLGDFFFQAAFGMGIKLHGGSCGE